MYGILTKSVILYTFPYIYFLKHLFEYRIEQNFGGKNFWRNCDFETLAEKSLANPRLACIFIIVRAR